MNTAGTVEGLNNRIRVLQRRAYSDRDEDLLPTQGPHLHAAKTIVPYTIFYPPRDAKSRNIKFPRIRVVQTVQGGEPAVDPQDQLLIQIRGAVSGYERMLIAELMRTTTYQHTSE